MAATEKYDDVQVAAEVEDNARKHDVGSKEDSQRSDDETLSTTSGAKLIEVSQIPLILLLNPTLMEKRSKRH